MADFLTLDDVETAGKRVLVRGDLNVPMKDGAVTDDTRLRALIPTLNDLRNGGARIALLSHFGRPKGQRRPEMSLKPVAEALARILDRNVAFAGDCIGDPARQVIDSLDEGEIAVLENLRFHEGEEANDPAFAAELAALGDLYVNDAFSAAHRAHASVAAITDCLPAAAGRSLQAEIDALTGALEDPERPVAALIGGAKISTKLDVLGHLLEKVDALIIGGAMANTFLAAQGTAIGKSLSESDLLETAREIAQQAKRSDTDLILPVDARVAEELAENAESRIVAIDAVGAVDMILDIGPETIERLKEKIDSFKTLLWNGPLGAFEVPPFDTGTVAIARHAAERTKKGTLRTVAGGGDTVSALNHAAAAKDFSHVSTAGGAFLEWLEGRELPGITALKKAAARR